MFQFIIMQASIMDDSKWFIALICRYIIVFVDEVMVSINEGTMYLFRKPIGSISSDSLRFVGNVLCLGLGIVANNLFLIICGVIID